MALIGGQNLVLIRIELREAPDIIPHRFRRGVKNMGAIPMTFDSGSAVCLRIGVSSDMEFGINHQNTFIQDVRDPFRDHASGKTGADNKKFYIFKHIVNSSSF